ncbi:hypothetical protein GF389_05795 [Candidatus Dojkabacteria bacterium]|nr:hypothetical protein [Candidatus Dojkabacteria bacterium]
MRKSKKREAILKTLKISGLTTAEELTEELTDIDTATIYRNLNKFCEEGIVREVRIKKGISSYEFIKDNHQHLICTNCEEIKRLDVNTKQILDQLRKENPWLKNYEIEDLEINLRAKSKKACK